MASQLRITNCFFETFWSQLLITKHYEIFQGPLLGANILRQKLNFVVSNDQLKPNLAKRFGIFSNFEGFLRQIR